MDSPATINGYSGFITTNFAGDETDNWNNDLGEPMSVGPGCEGQDPSACNWIEQVDSLPAGVTGLSAFYGYGGEYAGLADGLAAVGNPLGVITGLNVNEAANSFGMSFVTESTGGNFDMVAYTVPVSGLSDAIAAESAKSRVVRAITWNGSEVTFLSYGWTGDISTVYQTSVLQVTYANAGPMAEQLAQDGYIITACGGDNTVAYLWMVGTKVQGDTLPRPMMVAAMDQSSEPLAMGGYATVAIFSQSGGANWWIGER